MDSLIYITRNITFEDLKSGKKRPLDVYEEQIKAWLIKPIEILAKGKTNNIENGYAMFALELLFFEPHGKYLSGNKINGSKKCFDTGFNLFLDFLRKEDLVDDGTLTNIQKINFYKVSRCGIFHDMTIKSGLLIDSLNLEKSKVFYKIPDHYNIDRVLVNPWNFLHAFERYFFSYIERVRSDSSSELAKNFYLTFNQIFKY